MSMVEVWTLVPLFFATALVYATVGFGGGSTYLALLALCGVPYLVMPKIALVCNLIVVSGGLYHYLRARQLAWHLVVPFLVTSMPMAYLGGTWMLPIVWFRWLLGVALVSAGGHMLWKQSWERRATPVAVRQAWLLGPPIGAALGLLSGLVGLGGGIFLAPVLHGLGWGNARQIAAAASAFIFANSLWGLLGQLQRGDARVPWSWMLPLALAVFLGGQIGSRLSIGVLSLRRLQQAIGTMIVLIAMRVLWRMHG